MLCVRDFEEYASKQLAKATWGFFANGAEREVTLRENTRAFERYYIIPRMMLRAVARRDLSVSVLGERIDLPIGLAPTASQKMAHPDGEIAAAKAAVSMGTVYTLSTLATTSVEEVNEKVPDGLRWLQVYLLADKQDTARLVQRAERSGFKALVLTVDTPIKGVRLPERRTPLILPPHLSQPNIMMEAHSPLAMSDTLTWDDVKWLRSISKLPIVLKGILSAEDAKLAVQNGAAAVWVSNHGGRQLDGAIATIDALKDVVNAVKGTRCEVYVDGGIRWGSDVFKALVLGARAVFIGRPLLWGLAHSGEDGVRQILNILKDELNTCMTLSGCCDYSELESVTLLKTGFCKM